MGPKDFIEIPSAQLGDDRTAMEVVEQGPRFTLFGRVSKAIHIGKTPLLVIELTNNGIDVIRGR